MDTDISQARTPSLARRMAALLYDSMILFGVLLLAGGLVIVPYMTVIGPVFPSQAWWFRSWLVAVVAGFYAYFWTHGGQTLGMNAWRLRLVRADGAEPRFTDALLRLACATVALAPAGLGLLWVLIDPDHLAWHDRWSRTRLVLVTKATPPPAGT